MAARQAAAKLHMVTMVRSPCNRPAEVRATLERLGLTRMSQTVVHKNTPAINGMLRRVMEHVDVVPVTFAPEAQAEAHANHVSYGAGKSAFVLPTGVVQGLTEKEAATLDPVALAERVGGIPQAKGQRSRTNAKRRQRERKMKHLGNISDGKQWRD